MASSGERLRLAALRGDAEQVSALLRSGARLDTDVEGRTGLHHASANGHAGIVKSLIDHGAKINALDTAGYSPLHQASTEGHEEVVKLLLKAGCRVDVQDELHGNTALHESAWKGFSRTVEILCKNRANVYIKNNGGFTPLHLACQNGHNQSCRILLLCACKPDVRNSYGDTPLHTAARYGHAGVLRILISAFANVNETNKNGDSPLHISAAMGRNKLTRILLEAGCDKTLKNNQGETAHDIAERKEFSEIIRLLNNPPVTCIPIDGPKKEPSAAPKKRENSNTSQEGSSQKEKKKEKHKKSKRGHKVHFSKGNTSPYGCHMFPDVSHFPAINLKSLPNEPLQNGEQYYADLAGNIKKGPRGLGYMCYCAPFFNHVEKKLDSHKKELLDRIDARSGKLEARISDLEARTRDRLVSLSQRIREGLALERADCTERIERRLFRERRSHSGIGVVAACQPDPSAQQQLIRSKSDDLLSETCQSTSRLSSAVTSAAGPSSRRCGARPKLYNGAQQRDQRFADLKRDSKSEGDLTSCHEGNSQRTWNGHVRVMPHYANHSQANRPLPNGIKVRPYVEDRIPPHIVDDGSSFV